MENSPAFKVVVTNFDETCSIEPTVELLKDIAQRSNVPFTFEEYPNIPLREMKSKAGELRANGEVGLSVFVVSANEPRININEKDAQIGYYTFYEALRDISKDRVLIVIQNDDNYVDGDDGHISRYIRRKILGQFGDNYIRGPEGVIVSWNYGPEDVHRSSVAKFVLQRLVDLKLLEASKKDEILDVYKIIQDQVASKKSCPTSSVTQSIQPLNIPNPAPLQAENLWCVRADAAVKLRIDSTNESLEPLTVHTLFSQAVHQYGKESALVYKEDPTKARFTYISYVDYYQLCCQAARGFIKLGLQRFESVGILGFNSVEWVVSSIGAIFAGGLSCGIYETNSAEACHYIADHSRAAIIVVENGRQLNKILQVRDRLPKLKAIIQYCGEVTNEDPMVHTWNDFMTMSKDLPNTELIDRLKSQRPNQCCSLIYTSGTTGDPKGVMISHDNMTFLSRVMSEKIVVTENDFLVSYLPLNHSAAMFGDIFFPLANKLTVYFAQPDALKGTLFETLKKVRPEIFFGFPRVWEKMKEVAESVTFWKNFKSWGKDSWALAKNIGSGVILGISWRDDESKPGWWTSVFFYQTKKALGFNRCKYVASGAAPIRRDTLNYFLNLGIEIKEAYGLSETCGPNNCCFPDEYCISSVGTDLSGCKNKIDNPDANGNGEVCMYGRHVFMGYLDDEERSLEAFDGEGYFRSGDIGKYETISGRKYLFITGRLRDVITTAEGENVAPVPIENRILEHLPCIANAMLIGDKQTFISLIIAFKTVINVDTHEPTDQLTPAAQRWLKSVGCSLTSVSQLIETRPAAVLTAIQAGIDLCNKQAVSRAQKIQKWRFIPREFSQPGGELGPTWEVKRPVVVKMYEGLIEQIYAE